MIQYDSLILHILKADHEDGGLCGSTSDHRLVIHDPWSPSALMTSSNFQKTMETCENDDFK